MDHKAQSPSKRLGTPNSAGSSAPRLKVSAPTGLEGNPGLRNAENTRATSGRLVDRLATQVFEESNPESGIRMVVQAGRRVPTPEAQLPSPGIPRFNLGRAYARTPRAEQHPSAATTSRSTATAFADRFFPDSTGHILDDWKSKPQAYSSK